MKIIGTFRDLDDETKFVWLRGFPSMDDRARSLGDFYGGPIWQSNRETANATMVDSDDVLLLRPARAGSSFQLDAVRPPLDAANDPDRGIVEASILNLAAPADTDTLAYFDAEIAPRVAAAGASVLAYLVHRRPREHLLRLAGAGRRERSSSGSQASLTARLTTRRDNCRPTSCGPRPARHA